MAEELAKAIFYAHPPSNPHGPNSDLVFNEPYTASETKVARKIAAVLESQGLATTEVPLPTDDELQAASDILAIARGDVAGTEDDRKLARALLLAARSVRMKSRG